MLGWESAMVVGLRSRKLAAGGPAAKVEARRMVKEGKELTMGKGILLWLLGVPIPIIILILLIW